MGLKYRDAVVLVQKSPDGTIRRVNAIVLASVTHTPRTADRKLIKDAKDEEHLELMYPREMPDGHVPKSRNADSIFQYAYEVRPWDGGLNNGGLNIGWHHGTTTGPGYHPPDWWSPLVETKYYSDGSSATGVAPLPDQSPEQQAQAEKAAAEKAAADAKWMAENPPADEING